MTAGLPLSNAHLHAWDVTPAEAIALQQSLRDQVRIEPLPEPPSTIAGCDISFERDSEVIYAGVVVLRLPELAEVDRAVVVTRTRFPYIPGLLSFRETPPLLEAWAQLRVHPDVVMLDGQGLAHPRRFGIACHFGLLTETPSIGCAKSILVGNHGALDEAAGSWVPLVHRGETVGAAVRTKARVAPVYVSIGHRIDLTQAVDLTLRCIQMTHPSGPSPALFAAGASGHARYRIPEPTRLAHLLVNAVRRGETADV